MKRPQLDNLNADSGKAFYFLEPKRSRIDSQTFPSLANESPEDAQSRYLIFQDSIDSMMSSINHILQNANNLLYQDLLRFTRAPTLQKSTQKSFIAPLQKLPVGYILLTSNSANNSRVFNEFYRLMKQEPSKLVVISSKLGMSSVKMIMRAILKQLNEEEDSDEAEDDDDEEDQKDRVNYNIDSVVEWAGKERNKNNRLVIVLEELDVIEPQIFNHFLQNFYSCIENVDVKIIGGVTTDNLKTWINNTISAEFRLYLDNYKFSTTSNEELFYSILHEVVIKGEVLIDDVLMNIILSRFRNSNNSVDTLINELKMCLMIHYYQNSYARLTQKPATKKDVEILRHLPSFKASVETKLHRTRNTGELNDVKQLLTDDQYVIKCFNDTREQYIKFKNLLSQVIGDIVLLSPGTSVFEVYNLLIQDNFAESELNQEVDYDIQVPFNKNTIFHEVFLVGLNHYSKKPKLDENYSNLMIHLLRPNLRRTLENNLSDSSPYLENLLINKSSNIPPVIIQLFSLYVEAPATFNQYEFFMAFKQSLNRNKILKELKAIIQAENQDQKLIQIIDECIDDDKNWDKMLYAWFLQICNEFSMFGLIKEKPRGDHFEKNIWKGL